MNSFDKTFEILEAVVLQNGSPLTPTAVALRTGIHPVTCARILSGLAKKGYLEQISRRGGYVAGPMTASLGTRRNSYTLLASAARAPLAELAGLIRRQVNLSVLSGKERIMIVCECPLRDWRPWPRFRFSGESDTAATEKLLDACRPTEPGRKSPDRKKSSLRKRVEFSDPGNPELVIMGNLILAEGFPPAAFGFGADRSGNLAEIREKADWAAREIEKKLNPEKNAY